MWIPKILLKGFYNFMLVGLPSVTYNPLNKESIFHSPVKIDSTSTYINYKIPKEKFNVINKYIKKYNNDLSLIPTRIASDQADYYISVNIYNCSSPIFNSVTKDKVTRCEINTYVVNEKGEEGTLIMDYLNGIYDKLYYDSSLVKSSIRLPSYVQGINFKFLDIEFIHVDSIFYFEDPLNFVGAIWSNLNDY
jgi:hypothetical protein